MAASINRQALEARRGRAKYYTVENIRVLNNNRANGAEGRGRRGGRRSLKRRQRERFSPGASIRGTTGEKSVKQLGFVRPRAPLSSRRRESGFEEKKRRKCARLWLRTVEREREIGVSLSRWRISRTKLPKAVVVSLLGRALYLPRNESSLCFQAPGRCLLLARTGHSPLSISAASAASLGPTLSLSLFSSSLFFQ